MAMSLAQAKAIALMQAMNEIAHPDGVLPPGLSLLGVGRSAVAPMKAELERRTRHSVWSLQPRLRFDPEDEAYELDRRSRARLDLWHVTWRESTRVLPGGTRPPLDARQLDVARGLCLGRTDKAIARQLRMSERTVARDVAAILRVTEARSRAEAVLNMLGRGPHSRT